MLISDWSSDVCSSDLLHVNRLKAHAVGRRVVAILADERVAEAEIGPQAPRHLRDAAGLRQMEVVRKFEVAVLAGIARERRAPEDRPIAVPAGDEGGLERGMGGAEIAGIGKLRSEERRVGKEWVSTGES